MSERRGTKALETWCRRLTEGYPGVKVENMTTSWRDGLAFCAIIHHFKPELIDFNSLNKQDVYYNNNLAFRVAERQLGIPALLDAEDMVEYDVPDRLSILTYLSQFYQVFGATTPGKTAGIGAVSMQGSPARLVAKRPAVAAERGIVSPASTSPPSKMAVRASAGVTGSALGRREPCAKCGFPVFLAERLNVGTKLYHRTCFRCARCNNQLSLANCYETETDGQYCCETCPDEEENSTGAKIAKFDSVDTLKSDKSEPEGNQFSLNLAKNDAENDTEKPDDLGSKVEKLDEMRNRSLSDEEKSKGLQKFEDDEYSAHFENALEENDAFAKARNNFLSSHLLGEDSTDVFNPKVDDEQVVGSDSPPPLPASEPPDIIKISSASLALVDSSLPEADVNIVDVKLGDPDTKTRPDSPVNSTNRSDTTDQQDTASDSTKLDESATLRKKEITKDTNRSSLVKSRMLLFEAGEKANNVSRSIDKNKVNAVSKYFNHSKDNKNDANNPVPSTESDKLSLEPRHDVSIVSNSTNCEFNLDEPAPESESTENSISNTPQKETTEEKPPETPEPMEVSVSNSKEPEDTNDSEDADSELKKTQYVSVMSSSSEAQVDETTASSDAYYKTVRSEINNSDSLDVDSSLSKEDSPLDVLKPPDLKVKQRLCISIFENLSTEQSSISLDPSILESTNTSKSKDEYPDDLNPFGDDEEESVDVEEPKPGVRRQLIKPSVEDCVVVTPEPESRKPEAEKLQSTNPFGSSDEDEEEVVVKAKPPRPPLPTVGSNDGNSKRVLMAPRISLNPFWSDGDEPSEEDGSSKPVPLPRTVKTAGTPEPKPRRSKLSKNSDRYDSSSSLSSMNSSIGQTSGRKKKPAPRPPTVQNYQEIFLTPLGSKQNSPTPSTQPSPKLTPRVKKNRKAPLPPSSTPFVLNVPSGDDALNMSPILCENADPESKIEAGEISQDSLVLSPASSLASSDLEKEKISKDEKNRNRQSQSLASPVQSDSDSLSLSQHYPNSTDKSTHGKWKRKKGPAPARPVPQRRQVRPLPLAELRQELDMIEMQQQGLEKQGVKLEQLIREQCEAPGVSDDTALSPEVEDLVLELFELVNEKNELFRRQAELMYLRRQQRLEEEQADLEYQIRCLMARPEQNKTDSDKAREEELINRLVEVVERRNEIVECLEMDRVREAEEDLSINSRLSMMASKRDEEAQMQAETPVKLSKKEKKKIKKEMKLKEKGKTTDIDKDIDESESTSTLNAKTKKKKKWF